MKVGDSVDVFLMMVLFMFMFGGVGVMDGQVYYILICVEWGVVYFDFSMDLKMDINVLLFIFVVLVVLVVFVVFVVLVVLVGFEVVVVLVFEVFVLVFLIVLWIMYMVINGSGKGISLLCLVDCLQLVSKLVMIMKMNISMFDNGLMQMDMDMVVMFKGEFFVKLIKVGVKKKF